MVIVLYFKVEGPMEERIVSLYEDLKNVLSDNANLTAEAAEIKAAVDTFKSENANLAATVAQLQSTISNGGAVTESQLQELLDLAKAKDARILDLFTPDATPTPPTGAGE